MECVDKTAARMGPEKSRDRTTGSSDEERETIRSGGGRERKRAGAKARPSAETWPRRSCGIMLMAESQGRPERIEWKRTQKEAGYGRGGASH